MTTILVLTKSNIPSIFEAIGEFYEIVFVHEVVHIFERIARGGIGLTFIPYSISRKDPYITRGFHIYQHPYLIYSAKRDSDIPLSVISLDNFNKYSLSYIIEQKFESWAHEKLYYSIDMEDNSLDLFIEGKLLDSVSHDFGNALTLIIGFSNVLLEKIDPDDEDKVYLENVLDAVNDSYSLIRRLISFKNLKSLSVDTNLDLLRFLEVGEKLWRKFVEKKYELNTIFQVPSGIKINTDLRLIEFGIFHLLLKLKSFDTTSTSIAVYYVKVEEKSQWKFDFLAEIQKNPLMEVMIVAELFSSAIKIFRRVDLNALIEIVRNEENSQVFISFIVEEKPELTDLSTLVNYIPKHVIVIDPDTYIRETLTRYFTKLGFTVGAFKDTLSAFEVIEKSPKEIDTIMIDTKLEGEDLFRFQREVSRINSQIRVVAMSGSNRLHCLDLGLLPKEMEFIQKPIDFKSLQLKFYN